ncbi:MAG TPA: fatty acid--CoA ligase family protein [Pyrinomonadaceae bacterium]|jgi:acyl-coenzyme A synthetase/AMP-(fatty) acid ligase
MFIDFLLERMRERAGADAIIWKDHAYSYGWLEERVRHWANRLESESVERGAVTLLEADFSPNSVALFLALTERGCILVPLTQAVRARKEEFAETAHAEVSIVIGSDDSVRFERLERRAAHPLYSRLRAAGHPGLVLFSSGSTGESKAAVHDLVGLLEKFKVRRQRLRTITFLLYDHIGGVNTMLYTLSNTGSIVTVEARTPDEVLRLVEKYSVELLPTSPTFINLILLSEAYSRHSLRSLKTITYGTEPMPESTLKRFHELFPQIKLLQTYGLSEVGILRSKSKSSDSLWVKVGGEGYETRVRDGVLQIKARSAMLGYLNAPSPFTEDGWLNTGDAVEVDGEYLRILGRRSELINVGGEKVYPAEVESVMMELDSVAEATVYGEPNPITGQIVCANVTPARPVSEPREKKELVAAIKRHCRARLQAYKVPVKINLKTEGQHSERFKKVRR